MGRGRRIESGLGAMFAGRPSWEVGGHLMEEEAEKKRVLEADMCNKGSLAHGHSVLGNHDHWHP